MIRALTIGILALVSSSAAKAAGCDWTTAVYESKVSDTCQKELESKATNEQDKVYVRRLFKEWEPLPSSTEVFTEGGMIQLADEKEEYLFQAQWMSMEPPIMWINGAVVTDKSTDTSMYRRVERMIEASEQATPSTAWVNPFRYLFQSNEARAAKNSRATNMVFLYTLSNGFTGTASEILTGAADDDALGVLPDRETSGIGRHFFGSKDQYQCNGKSLADTNITIDGKQLKVHSLGHSTFMLKGMIDGQDVKVSLHGRPMYPKELKELHTNKKTGLRYSVVGLPCQAKYSPDLASACKDKWAEFASKHEEAKKYISGLGSEVVYGRDVKCTAIYKGKENIEKRRECLNFFASNFPRAGMRYHEGTASFSMCVDREGKSKCDDVKDASEVVKAQRPGLRDDKRAPNAQVAYNARKNYREALKKAGYQADDYCSMPKVKSTGLACGAGIGEFGCDAGSDNDVEYAKCSFPKDKPPKDAKVAAQLRALEIQANNPNRVEVQGATSAFKSKVETRLMGLMMLADCCGDPTCSQKIYSSRKIDLKGAAQGPVAPARQ